MRVICSRFEGMRKRMEQALGVAAPTKPERLACVRVSAVVVLR